MSTDVHLRFGELDPDDVRLYPAGPDSGGGVTYARSTSDVARAADTVARALVAARTTNDSATATDSVVAMLVLLVTRARLRIAHRLLTQLTVEEESCPSA